ncbi:hypothetical protein Vretimale_19698 [Volvox reticuliferus]|uniref:Pherophorin domain-containing protein n=1 Tax=Volvox reticuliferus TaxID=1737510 RepID=A0A8J4FD22_9CHLO|nr:hypothetical protein Vretifemale_835 [Volvox reticuliferus]GIM17183.1 hypothetical protein Vretimale_19698 [Volvox reticuliferus]
MTGRSFLPVCLVAALALGWTVSASADDDEYNENREQTGSISDFPFRSCNKTNGAYRLAPVWRPAGGGQYCFKIEVRQEPQSCSGACCTAALHKIEFNVSSSCLVAGSSVTATLNGVPTRVGPVYDRPPSGPPGSAILRITQLGLDPVMAQGAELCITLKPNRARQGCTTLEQMCVSTGFPAGTCTAATFDVAWDCCPVSQVVQAQPPPPPPPPTPPSPLQQPPQVIANRPCDVCVTAMLTPPQYDIRPYRFDNATCAAIQQSIADDMNYLLSFEEIDVYTPFSAQECTGTRAVTCGSFSGNDLDKLQDMFNILDATYELLLYFLYAAFDGDVCDPRIENYAVTVTTDGNQCLDLTQSVACSPPMAPFPNCTCDTTQGVLPYMVAPTYYTRASLMYGPSVMECCFSVKTLRQDQVVPSTCYKANDTLAKIEWLANDAQRSVVKGFTVTPAGGPTKTVSPSWGAKGTNTLKVNLNWSEAQADGGVVCVALQKPYTMEDLGLPWIYQSYVSVFNRDSQDYCCPLFRTAQQH